MFKLVCIVGTTWSSNSLEPTFSVFSTQSNQYTNLRDHHLVPAQGALLQRILFHNLPQPWEHHHHQLPRHLGLLGPLLHLLLQLSGVSTVDHLSQSNHVIRQLTVHTVPSLIHWAKPNLRQYLSEYTCSTQSMYINVHNVLTVENQTKFNPRISSSSECELLSLYSSLLCVKCALYLIYSPLFISNILPATSPQESSSRIRCFKGYLEKDLFFQGVHSFRTTRRKIFSTMESVVSVQPGEEHVFANPGDPLRTWSCYSKENPKLLGPK